MSWNWPYVHTLINHFPIVLSVIATAVIVVALITGRRAIWLYGLATLVLAGLSVYPAYFTGDQASDTMRHVWYVVPAMISAHSDAADYALWAILLAGVVAAYAWWRMTRRGAPPELPGTLRVLVVITALLGLGTVTYAAYLGGKIVHESPKLATPPAGATGTAPP